MANREERDRILAKARDRFLKFGFAKVTLDEIASDLGMSKKTLYKHFESKEALLKSVIRTLTHSMGAKIEQIVSSNLPFQTKAKRLLTEIGTTVGTISQQLQRDIQRYVPELWTEVEEFRRQVLMDKIGRMFQQGIREKVFRQDLNPELFLLMFLSAVQGVINPTVLSNQSFSASEAFAGILEILFEGALSDEARGSMLRFDSTIPTSS